MASFLGRSLLLFPVQRQRLVTRFTPGIMYLSTTAPMDARRTNTCINFVPQQEAWIVERFGRYLKTLEPGLNILIPIVDTIKYVQSLKEAAIPIPSQSAITEDNVTLHLDGVLYYRIIDPFKASYGVEHAEYAVVQLAQTTMRSELGKIKLDSVFQERTNLNYSIVDAINHAAEAWGIRCMRYEIKDIQLPTQVREAMQMQVEAERKKRANILESEGVRESAINRAMGIRQSKILASEAMRIEQVNKAKGESSAILAKALARTEAINLLGNALGKKHGSKAASLSVAEQYVQAFGNLAKSSNTVLLPEKTGDISSMVGQAMAIYGHMTKSDTTPTDDGPSPPPEDKLSDFENMIEKLNQNIDETLTQRYDSSTGGETVAHYEENKDTNQPHFTLDTSVTKDNPYKKE